MEQDNESAGITYAKELGVNVPNLRDHLQMHIDNCARYEHRFTQVTLSVEELKMLKACVEVACDF
jgi:hypothetical protein